jgi:hypothetical protein
MTLSGLEPTTFRLVAPAALVRVRSAFHNILECSRLGPPWEARRKEREGVMTLKGYVRISV